MGPYIGHRHVLDQSKLWSRTVPSGSWKPRCFTLLATNNLTHRRIYAQPFGLVRIFIASLATEHRLRPPSRQCYHLFSLLRQFVEDVFRHHRQSQDVLQFPVGLQACAVRNLRTMKLQLQTSVETDAQHVLFHFTHWISCCLLPSPWEHPLFIGLNNTSGSNNNLTKWKIRGHLNRLPISRQPIFLELTKFSIVEFSTTPPKKKAHSRTLSNSRSSRHPILTTFCKFEENKTT